MTISIKIRSPEDTRALSSAFVSFGSFYVVLELTSPTPALPLTVEITEISDPVVGPPLFRVPSHQVQILDLGRATKIVDPSAAFEFLHSYDVASLTSFTLRTGYPKVQFRVCMKTDDTTIESFKGSKMVLTVRDGGSYRESAEIPILIANPNNHYHWRNEAKFVDGAYFKCVHVDHAAFVATPFFFLYGVCNPKGPPDSESFAMAGRAGSIALDALLLRPLLTSVPSAPEPNDPKPRPAGSVYTAEQMFGLDAKITTDFTASDVRCTGNATLPSGGIATWDLLLTKLHKACVTDWNPLAHFQNAFFRPEEEPYGPLSRHTVSFPGTSAFYMSHNMNSFVSGTITWDGKRYDFDDSLAHKGYQDSNWGASDFPHPYVWMQANNFVDSWGAPLHDTSLVALYTPNMPITLPGDPTRLTTVAGICLRHAGTIYEVITFDTSLVPWYTVLISPLATRAPEFFVRDVNEIATTFDCMVEFITAAGRKYLDMSRPGDIPTTIGLFPRLPLNPEIQPVKWTVHGVNRAGDDILIVATCDPSTVMKLAAPMNGKMEDNVTKESLLVRFDVTLKPKGGIAISMVSDFGTAEFGD